MSEEDKKYLREQLEYIIRLCIHGGYMSTWRSVYEMCINNDEKISLNISQKEELYQQIEKIVCDANIPENHLYSELENFADNYIATLSS